MPQNRKKTPFDNVYRTTKKDGGRVRASLGTRMGGSADEMKLQGMMSARTYQELKDTMNHRKAQKRAILKEKEKKTLKKQTRRLRKKRRKQDI